MRAEAALELARAQASVGQHAEARWWVDRLPDREARAWGLLGIGEALLPPPEIDVEWN